jgi:hypothetical protein
MDKTGTAQTRYDWCNQVTGQKVAGVDFLRQDPYRMQVDCIMDPQRRKDMC